MYIRKLKLLITIKSSSLAHKLLFAAGHQTSNDILVFGLRKREGSGRMRNKIILINMGYTKM